mmetsp:Transcript_15947/g.23329  ORF Transcript_15947/g.23329 Transcript_15947/m.23329 type:complete len:129 (+) Transcript_15947:336-722(+)
METPNVAQNRPQVTKRIPQRCTKSKIPNNYTTSSKTIPPSSSNSQLNGASPAKKIQPHFHKIAQTCNRNKTKTAFATVDVDGLEDIVAEYKVVAMPTFIAIRNGSKVSSMSGANEDNLDSFVKKVLEA